MKTFVSILDPEQVDPQLRNNQELSKLLQQFEEAWMAGTEHLLDAYNREDLIQFSDMVLQTCQRHQNFAKMLESCEASVFVSLPSLAVLHNMQRVIKRFAPSLRVEDLVLEVHKSCKQSIIELEVLDLASTGIRLAQKVKSCGIQLMRANSEKWNQLSLIHI